MEPDPPAVPGLAVPYVKLKAKLDVYPPLYELQNCELRYVLAAVNISLLDPPAKLTLILSF
jgi:hypothetical protein